MCLLRLQSVHGQRQVVKQGVIVEQSLIWAILEQSLRVAGDRCLARIA